MGNPISCRNRHCPSARGSGAHVAWPNARPTCCRSAIFHVVFTVPAEIADIGVAQQGGRLRRAVSVAPARPCSPSLPTPSSRRAYRHHRCPPHLGLGDDTPSAYPHDRARRRHLGSTGRSGSLPGPGSLLPVRVLAKLFRGRFLARLQQLHASGQLQLFRRSRRIKRPAGFSSPSAPLRKKKWVVYGQSSLRRATSSARLSVAIHPPRRHFRTADWIALDDTGRHLPLQGLPSRRRRAPAHHDPQPR